MASGTSYLDEAKTLEDEVIPILQAVIKAWRKEVRESGDPRKISTGTRIDTKRKLEEAIRKINEVMPPGGI